MSLGLIHLYIYIYIYIYIDDDDDLSPRSGADVMRGWRNVFDAYVWGDA